MEAEKLLYDILYIILTLCVPVIVKYLISFLSKKVNEVQTRVANEKINFAIDYVEDIVSKIVLDISQTYVDSLKKDGCFTKEAAENAHQLAVTKAKNLLNEAMLSSIQELYGGVDEYLDILVEALVARNKK